MDELEKIWKEVIMAKSIYYPDICLEGLRKKTALAMVRQRTMPTERPPLVGEVVPTFADRGCCVVSATDAPGR
jgi:hypothetical protein